MAVKKNHYYVLVFTETGCVYVTSFDYGSKTAYWRRDEKPCEMSRYVAEDLVFGLTLNFHHCVMVCCPYSIDSQPYNYVDYECKFVRKEGGNDNV